MRLGLVTQGSVPHLRPERVLLALQSVTVGGMETQCLALGSELVRRGAAVAVVVPEGTIFDDLSARFGAAGVNVLRLDTDGRNGRATQALRIARLVRRLRRWRPDVVHVHTGGASGGVAIVAAARLATSATIIMTEHNVPFAEPGVRLRLATRLKDRLVHAVVALSARNAALRRKWLGAPPKFVGIRPGIPIDESDHQIRLADRERIRAKLNVPSSATVIGSMVRLAPDKGLDDLLSAFALVNREASCELLLVGDGPLRASLEGLAANLGVSQRVHFEGYHAEAAPFLGVMDIFVLSAPAGSGSIALLEAMAHGLPAVITYCGRGEFLLPDKTGLCAPPNDPAGLARVMLRLVRDRGLRARLGESAAEHARREFRIERVAADLLEVYAGAKTRAIPGRLLATSLDAE